ncbi:two-component system sensor histidine kinase QseC [Serratia marcescens]|uniref:quorum sensing histidine kinase QseC n=1 Tax=Serratia TaxID=613 RepID=UPI001249D007|nr:MULTISPECIES: quorum sensing histidine kinase QseC [Serratia]KAB1577855.1 two-component system sensor histidine kinase QseC [Serratia marcescens]MBH2951163.1 two-component system sensor histidine kinase QseC [Serratia marcescens]MBH3171251.1 two-component system sensor histidine kinase QseC [Serratia marcescens]MBH3234773.1 two-component system sensor histidine kinase QseC [Serratia marcescens]UMK56769.1 two-component system sensor histidine kinase QseC [Serratia marcescens]
MKRLSLRLRLILIFSLLALLTWCTASVVAWVMSRNTINEVFDTQQMLFAKRLATANLGDLLADESARSLPKTKKLVHHGKRGEQDDDALAFAIFDRDGKMLLNDGENGADFLFDGEREGFTDGERKGDDDSWRLVWLTSPDGRYRIVVGQEWDYRRDMALGMVTGQLVPWLATLPVLMLLIALMVGRELRPLRAVAAGLRRRAPDDATPLDARQVPTEVRPLVDALNALFARINALLVRERRFTSDAAHELRSPLAALRVQTEVVQLAGDDAPMREHALDNLTVGIDRATRLVDQLLTLSRLDSLSDLAELAPIDWNDLVTMTLAEQDRQAHAAGVTLRYEHRGTPPPRQGETLLLSLLLRNLLDNAVRYTPQGGVVTVTLSERSLTVEDDGPGVTAEHLARLGERFYRPPGQEQTGSGLGLSIVQRIAGLHGLQISFANRPAGGFVARLAL